MYPVEDALNAPIRTIINSKIIIENIIMNIKNGFLAGRNVYDQSNKNYAGWVAWENMQESMREKLSTYTKIN